jgi:hypothetical protein
MVLFEALVLVHGVQLHLRGTAAPASSAAPIRKAAPTSTAIPTRYSCTYDVHLHLRGTATLPRYSCSAPTIEKPTETISEI